MTRGESSPVLTLFARDPVPGAAKTRLAPLLGAEDAARLAHAMIVWTADAARAHWPGPVRLAVWPAGCGGVIGDRLDLPVLDQCGRDLGERMLNVLQGAGAPNAVMGCDVPHVEGRVLAQAAALLASGRHVVGPASDGGFYLLGLVHPVPGLFDGIEWGAGDVLDRLRDNVDRAGAAIEELPPLRDIDTPGDLQTVARMFAPLAHFVAASRSANHG